MKNTIYKIGFLLIILGIVTFSCTSPEAETNYTPADYEYPTGITLASGNITNSSFEFTYTNNGGGVGYYVVVEGGSAAPSNQDVFEGTATALVASGNFVLDGSPVVVTVNDDLCDGTAYDVYAVQFTTDNFLSDATVTITVTTNENANIAGTYDVISNGTMSGNFGDEVVTDYTSVVTITDNLNGTFRFSDITAGIYPDPNYYGVFGSPPVPKNIAVECNNFGGCYTSPFYNCCGDYICIDITINADGSLSVAWESAFGEVFTAEYTKQ